MSSLARRLAAGPLLALLTAGTYRSALLVLGGALSDGHVRWGMGMSLFACFIAWAHVFGAKREGR